MSIDDLTLGEIKKIGAMLGSGNAACECHPLNGKKVLTVLPHGFIYFGTLVQQGQYLKLTNASNLRYWTARDGGLPEFVAKGPNSGDKIDACSTEIWLSNCITIQEIVKW